MQSKQLQILSRVGNACKRILIKAMYKVETKMGDLLIKSVDDFNNLVKSLNGDAIFAVLPDDIKKDLLNDFFYDIGESRIASLIEQKNTLSAPKKRGGGRKKATPPTDGNKSS